MPTKILSRFRVNQQLERIFEHPLTVIRAPMGFGKTTALREYLRVKKLEPIWLPLLGSGGSLAYCWERLSAKISERNDQMGSRFANLGFPADPPQLANIVGMISEARYESPTVVVIDDYHLVDCRQVAGLITLVVAERVPNLQLVLLARETPALPVADLEQQGLCLLIGQETLQFRAEEIRDYFDLMAHPTSEDILQHVSSWTGGWISGIYLLLRGMRHGLPMGRREDIEQLLEVNLYQTYDESTQDFLRRLSLLDAFTLEQVVFVFENEKTDMQVLSLVQGNAFISYYSALNAYKMSDVLREFLQEKARLAAVDGRPIWRRMGIWFLDKGNSQLAYEYFYRAGELELILRDLNTEEGRGLSFTQFPKMHKIFEGLSTETALRYPVATLRHIRGRALTSPPSARGGLEQLLQSMKTHFEQIEQMPEEERTRVLGEIHNTWIFVAFNDVHSMVEHARKAVAYFNGRYSCIVDTHAEFTFGAPHLLYCYFNERGSMRERAEFISTNFCSLAQAVEGCGVGSQPLVLAEYALETGDFNNVEINAKKAIYQSRMFGQISIELCAVFTLARLYLCRGKFAEGERMLTGLAEVVSKQSSSVLNTTLELCLAYVNSCYGNVDAVPSWLRENDMGTGEFMFQGVAFSYIVCLRAVLLSGAFEQLEVLSQAFRKKFALYNNCLGYIHSYICSAIAKEQLYGIEVGCDELEQALTIAEADNVVMPFGENAIGILPMLRKLCCSTQVSQNFLRRVTACCESYYHTVSGLLPSVITFTDREREILRMIAQGMKHEEVAAILFISVPTVRYHVKNLYQKLEVNNKVLAIQKAKSLNLI